MKRSTSRSASHLKNQCSLHVNKPLKQKRGLPSHEIACAACYYWQEKIRQYKRKIKRHTEPVPFKVEVTTSFGRSRRKSNEPIIKHYSVRSAAQMSQGIPITLKFTKAVASSKSKKAPKKAKKQLQPTISQITLPSHRTNSSLKRKVRKIKQRASQNLKS